MKRSIELLGSCCTAAFVVLLALACATSVRIAYADGNLGDSCDVNDQRCFNNQSLCSHSTTNAGSCDTINNGFTGG
jgi:hypothetical protein